MAPHVIWVFLLLALHHYFKKLSLILQVAVSSLQCALFWGWCFKSHPRVAPERRHNKWGLIFRGSKLYKTRPASTLLGQLRLPLAMSRASPWTMPSEIRNQIPGAKRRKIGPRLGGHWRYSTSAEHLGGWCQTKAGSVVCNPKTYDERGICVDIFQDIQSTVNLQVVKSVFLYQWLVRNGWVTWWTPRQMVHMENQSFVDHFPGKPWFSMHTAYCFVNLLQAKKVSPHLWGAFWMGSSSFRDVFFYVKEPVHWTTSNILNLVVQPGFHRNSGDHFARHEGGGDQQLCCCNWQPLKYHIFYHMW